MPSDLRRRLIGWSIGIVPFRACSAVRETLPAEWPVIVSMATPARTAWLAAHHAVPMESQEFDEWAQRIYMVEIGRHCRFAIQAGQDLLQHLEVEGVQLSAWYSAQAFLDACANVSRLLKPTKPKDKSLTAWSELRGSELRRLLDVNDDDPVLDRTVRNHFEHLDERLDAWTVAQPRPTAQQIEAGEYPPPRPPGSSPLRIINPAIGVIEYQGAKVHVHELLTDLRRIFSRATELQPVAGGDPGLSALMSLLPQLPKELRFDAPTRRPDEPVTTGVDLQAFRRASDNTSSQADENSTRDTQ